MKNKSFNFLKISTPLTYFNSNEDIKVLSKFIVSSYKTEKLFMYLIK